MAEHELKTHPRYFEKVVRGTKTFEIRKNDRDFHAGDILVLRELDRDYTNDQVNAFYTGRELRVRVTYLTNFPEGLREGFVCMGIR